MENFDPMPLPDTLLPDSTGERSCQDFIISKNELRKVCLRVSLNLKFFMCEMATKSIELQQQSMCFSARRFRSVSATKWVWKN